MRDFYVNVRRQTNTPNITFFLTLSPVEQDGPSDFFPIQDDEQLGNFLRTLDLAGDEIAAIVDDLEADGATVNIRREILEEIAEQLGRVNTISI